MALAMMRGVENLQLGAGQQDHNTVIRTLASKLNYKITHWKTHLNNPSETVIATARDTWRVKLHYESLQT